ncbi:PREDICTED: junctophilin-3, partial [Condylura cristata]|uniref:junctophilin-3 n=1 Tax=Condylura cristata TaxID=143302 RepID=UPI0006428AA4
MSSGGRFNFDDGGSYCGGWEDGKAHGHGVCTGPKGQGEYTGSWSHGFEVLGVYTWPSGNTYQGTWAQGKRHGLGLESKGKWVYRGEWTHGFKGRYGVRECAGTGAKYEGTWSNGLQDGYGTETYSDGGGRCPPRRAQPRPRLRVTPTWGSGMPQPLGGAGAEGWGSGTAHHHVVMVHAPRTCARDHGQSRQPDVVMVMVKWPPRPRWAGADASECAGDLSAEGAPAPLAFSGPSHAWAGGQEKPGGRLALLRARPVPGICEGHSCPVRGRVGGFVLVAHSDGEALKGKKKGLFRRSLLSGLKLRKSESKSSLASQRSKQSSFRSEAGMSTLSAAASDAHSTASLGEAEAELSVVEDDVDATTTETYAGEWKSDKRAGVGVSQRSDGLRYEGEWAGNRRHGYGCLSFPDGSREEGKYKQNALVSGKRKNLLPLRASKIRVVPPGQGSSQQQASGGLQAGARRSALGLLATAAQRDPRCRRPRPHRRCLHRTSHSRAKAEAALTAAQKAQEEARVARITAKEFSPSFQHRENGLEYQRPKHQLSSDDMEVLSTGTPLPQESPELYRKGTTPSDLTPDDSPLQSFPASPSASPPPAPAPRSRAARFSRQA